MACASPAGEPPDPFVWFTLICDDSEVDAIVTALLALPMVIFAGRRPIPVLAETISYGTNPRTASGQDGAYSARAPRRRCDLRLAGGRAAQAMVAGLSTSKAGLAARS